MLRPVNWEMISHPMNWVTFTLMVIIAGAIGHLTLSYLGVEPATAGTSSYNNVPAGQSPGQVSTGAISPQTAGLQT